MHKPALLLLAIGLTAHAQIQHTSVPLGDAIDKALKKSLLTSQDGRPFHLRVEISEPANPKSPYVGTLEEWWASSDQWRREVTAPNGVKQIIVVVDGKKSEQDVGDYLPLWLRNFIWAATDPLPNASAWTAAGITIDQITMPNGTKSSPCARVKSSLGTGPRATDAFSNVCFDASGRFDFIGSPRYHMEFHDYRGFGKKDVPRRIVDHPEPGTEIVGSTAILEDLAKAKPPADFFRPLAANDNAFESIAVNASTLEHLSANSPAIVWPPIHSGNIHGRLAVYLSVDRTGTVREAWPLNSDNAGLEDPAREQILQWHFKPAINNGLPVQLDGALGFAFDTTIGDPLPELSDAEVRALVKTLPEPVWSDVQLPHGTIIEIKISVNETGKTTGFSLGQVPANAEGPILNVFPQWSFMPLILNGHPQYFHGTLRFVVP